MSDDKNNALIIQASPHDYEILERTIKELDILPRQVLIDAKIYQVDLTGNLVLGISAFLDQKEKLCPFVTKGSFAAGQDGGSFQASTFSFIGNTRALQAFLSADENRSRVRTLSAPSVLVTDNTSARIQVGSEVPVPVASALSTVQVGGNSLFAQTIQFRDTGVILVVTPRISAGGIVNLTISQEVSAAIPNTTSSLTTAPIINKSAFQTSVVLHDGEPLALGGIITTSDTLSKNRVPLLGDIPGLGLLFGSTRHRTSRTEVVLLLTPHVIQDMSQAAANTEEFTNRMRQVKKLMEKEKK
jgi:general secretion pathway protein D